MEVNYILNLVINYTLEKMSFDFLLNSDGSNNGYPILLDIPLPISFLAGSHRNTRIKEEITSRNEL